MKRGEFFERKKKKKKKKRGKEIKNVISIEVNVKNKCYIFFISYIFSLIGKVAKKMQSKKTSNMCDL